MAKVLKSAALALLLSPGARAAGAPINIPLAATQITLDPTAVQDTQSLTVARQLHCQLLRMSGRDSTPEAADEIRFVSPTLLQMTLKPGVKFTDGRPVTADDVVATFELLKSSRLVLRYVFAWIDRVEAVDSRTVVFHLHASVPSFLKFLGAPNYALMPRDFIEKAKANPELWNNPVGCGKYRVGKWDRAGGLIELDPVADGRPLVFHLAATFSLDPAKLASFDVLDAPYGEALRTEDAGKYREVVIFDPKQYYLGLNTKLPAWHKKENRCRVLNAIDRSAIVAGYGSGAEVPKSFFPRGILGYAPDWPERALTGPAPLGRPFRLAFLELSVPKEKRGLYEKAVSAVVGPVKTSLIHDVSRYGLEFLSSGADGAVIGLRANDLDGYEFLATFCEPYADITGYQSAALKKRINATQQLNDPTQRAQSYRSVAATIADECLVLPLMTKTTRAVMIRKELATPGLGEGPLNEYDFSLVR